LILFVAWNESIIPDRLTCQQLIFLIPPLVRPFSTDSRVPRACLFRHDSQTRFPIEIFGPILKLERSYPLWRLPMGPCRLTLSEMCTYQLPLTPRGLLAADCYLRFFKYAFPHRPRYGLVKTPWPYVQQSPTLSERVSAINKYSIPQPLSGVSVAIRLTSREFCSSC